MRKIKVGQIGIGHNHGSGKMLAVRKLPELFEVVGFAEEDEVWIEKRGGLDAYADLPRMPVEELLEKVDAVLVECDVPRLTKTARLCVDAGKHIHMDKPASGTVKELQGLLTAAEMQALVVQLGYMYRYNPAIQQCMKMIAEGQLGEIYSINAEMSTRHYPDLKQLLKQYQNGGMYIFGSHLVDLIVYLLGEPERIARFEKQTGLDGIDFPDVSLAVLEYQRTIARIYVSSVEVNGWGRRQFVVSGSKGTVEIKPMENPVCMTYAYAGQGGSYADIKTVMDVKDISKDCRYDAMMQDFYDYIVGKKQNPFTYEHDLAVHRVITKICGEN